MTEQGERLELFISKFLRYGVLVAGGLMLAGWMMQISFDHNIFLDFQIYREARLSSVLQEAFRKNNVGLLLAYAGLATLIALPPLRVLMTLFIFARSRDWLMAGLTALVVSGLLLSLLLGFEL